MSTLYASLCCGELALLWPHAHGGMLSSVLCKMQKFILAGHCCSCSYFSAGEGTQGKASRASQRLGSQGAGL